MIRRNFFAVVFGGIAGLIGSFIAHLSERLFPWWRTGLAASRKSYSIINPHGLPIFSGHSETGNDPDYWSNGKVPELGNPCVSGAVYLLLFGTHGQSQPSHYFAEIRRPWRRDCDYAPGANGWLGCLCRMVRHDGSIEGFGVVRELATLGYLIERQDRYDNAIVLWIGTVEPLEGWMD